MKTIRTSPPFTHYCAALVVFGLQFLSVMAPVISAQAQSTASKKDNFDWTNLVSDIAGVADRTDPNLVNSWGLALNTQAKIFWVADNGTGLSTLYQEDGTIVNLVVTIPPTSADTGTPPTAAPTGIVFNSSTSAFLLSNGKPALFIFDGEDGGISAWNGALSPITEAVLVVDNSSPNPAISSVYKGLALANRTSGGPTLYAANFHNGTVDVYDSTFKKATITGSFTDPSLPPVPSGAVGWAPFDIVNIDGLLYVSFAAQNAVKHDDVGGPGNGFVDVFDTEGHLIKRLITQGNLNSPWGMANVPSRFGQFDHNVLLVGNFGDGHINAYDIRTGTFLSQLQHRKGQALEFNGLWSLFFLDSKLYFTAGIVDEAHGLFGVIVPAAKEELSE